MADRKLKPSNKLTDFSRPQKNGYLVRFLGYGVTSCGRDVGTGRLDVGVCRMNFDNEPI